MERIVSSDAESVVMLDVMSCPDFSRYALLRERWFSIARRTSSVSLSVFRLRSGPEPLHLAPISSLSFPLLRAKMPFQWSFEALNRPIPHSASGPSPLPRYRAGISHRFRGKAHSRGASFHSPNKDTVRSRRGYSLRPRLPYGNSPSAKKRAGLCRSLVPDAALPDEKCVDLVRLPVHDLFKDSRCRDFVRRPEAASEKLRT